MNLNLIKARYGFRASGSLAAAAGSIPALLCPLPTLSADVPVTNAWSWTASFAAKETWDNNVYLQSVADKSDKESFVTSLQPQIGIGWKPSGDFSANLNYAPEVVFFHSEDSEDHVAHRANFNLLAKPCSAVVDLTGSLVWIDGSDEGLIWRGPGGAPATGGPAVRDRRDAAVFRSALKVVQPLNNDFWVRPVATAYIHDFQTKHLRTPGYQNYVDRNEFTGGADLGHKFTSDFSGWFGYRFGAQDQDKLLNYPEAYGNTFHRALVGLEGKPFSWMKANLAVGPEFRHYGDDVPASFGDHNRLNVFIDSSLTLTPTKSDTIVASVKLFQQPGFGGRSAYDDLTYDLGWRHKFDKHWTVGAGGRRYGTDFLAPVVRDDWVWSGYALVNYLINTHLSAELSYGYEQGETADSNASGREYQRHLVALGLKYVFR